MKYFKNPKTQEVFGYDETDPNQLSLIQTVIKNKWADISDSWPVIPVPTKDEAINAISLAITEKLNAGAKLWGYDNIISAASYVTSTNKQYASDASLLITWRDDVWAWAIPLFANVTPDTMPDVFLKDMPIQPQQVIVS